MTAELACDHDPAAYLTGGLSPVERSAFRRHLALCPGCRRELARLQSAVDGLVLGTAPVRTPGTTQQPTMDELREGRIAERRAEARRRALSPALRGRHGLGLAKPVPRPVTVAFGALLLVGLVTVILGHQAAGLRLYPGRTAWPQARAAVRLDGPRGTLLVSGLPPAPAGETYELWLERSDGAMIRTGQLFGPDRYHQASVAIPGALTAARRVSDVIVTGEPAGGAPTAARTAVIVVALPQSARRQP